MTSKITEVWVVTYPTTRSLFTDILFSCSVPNGLARQFAGGLEPRQIAGIFTEKYEAEVLARLLLKTISP